MAFDVLIGSLATIYSTTIIELTIHVFLQFKHVQDDKAREKQSQNQPTLKGFFSLPTSFEILFVVYSTWNYHKTFDSNSLGSLLFGYSSLRR